MFTFKKEERLNNYKLIKKLRDSSFFVLSPLIKCIFLTVDNVTNSKYNIKLLIKIPKKTIKNATERNLIKRRIREVFRVNKHFFSILADKIILMQIEYLSTKNVSYDILQKEFQRIFDKINTLMNISKSY